MDIGATAPAITINDIGLKCFEKEKKYVDLNMASVGAVDTTFNNNILGFFKAPIDAAVTTTLIGDNIELSGAPLETLEAPVNVDTLVVFTVM